VDKVQPIPEDLQVRQTPHPEMVPHARRNSKLPELDLRPT
jgi:hypothetical protein